MKGAPKWLGELSTFMRSGEYTVDMEGPNDMVVANRSGNTCHRNRASRVWEWRIFPMLHFLDWLDVALGLEMLVPRDPFCTTCGTKFKHADGAPPFVVNGNVACSEACAQKLQAEYDPLE